MKFGNRKNTADRQATIVQAQGAPEPSLKSEAVNDATEAKVTPGEPVAEQSEAPAQAAAQDATPAS